MNNERLNPNCHTFNKYQTSTFLSICSSLQSIPASCNIPPAMPRTPPLWDGAALHLRQHQGSNTVPVQKTKAKVSYTALRFRKYKKDRWI